MKDKVENSGINDLEVVEQVVAIPLMETEEQGVVVIHCRFEGEGAIRIWRSTFLIDNNSPQRSKLLHAENISLYPQWTPVTNGGHTFTLFFEALPGSCKKFDLHEVIPQAGGFQINGISRNNVDVYRVNIDE